MRGGRSLFGGVFLLFYAKRAPNTVPNRGGEPGLARCARHTLIFHLTIQSWLWLQASRHECICPGCMRVEDMQEKESNELLLCFLVS